MIERGANRRTSERLLSTHRRGLSERDRLYERYVSKMSVNPDLVRQLVSFQANKKQPFYRWLKFKEAFSSQLVEYFIAQFRPDAKRTPKILDPFAGAGTTLTTSARSGWRATGIELLPVGTAAMKARLIAGGVAVKDFESHVAKLQDWIQKPKRGSYAFPHLGITRGAFSKQTEDAISSLVQFMGRIEDRDIRYLFWFACLSVLEDVSFTRKDGQYLRWDKRSGRKLTSNFDKGKIYGFWVSIMQKLGTMVDDIRSRNGSAYASNVNIIEGSCLDVLPTLTENTFDMILTSPPYCNRYDYTRTYALELAFLGYGEDAVKSLRQMLLSATVENKTKGDYLFQAYHKRNQEPRYSKALKAFTDEKALHEVLTKLYKLRDLQKLNNSNIPAMIENYFLEMCFVIHELARVTAPGGKVVMVNDNVQYHGEEIPVDTILSHFAELAGLKVEAIWVLARGKGNSSQQMGAHGRNELRKCVYVWSKPTQ
ncbi:MAG: hypothetical protein NTU47_02765 [Ignavibacteriales bacterium]|nr:hypothetical protein [Ignavibacteriales bacterium]